MTPRNLITGLVLLTAMGVSLAPSAVALDDGLEDPNACSSPFGGNDSREGTVITVPGGTSMPPGTPPAPPSSIPGAPYPPPLTTYVCSNGGWVPISSTMEVAVRIDPDAPSVIADEGNVAVMSGTYFTVDDSPVALTASVGQATTQPDGTWNWSMTPDDGPTTQTVAVTATAGESTATATFELDVRNVAPSVSSIVPASPVALVDQPVVFSGAATDPSAADTTAGFTWNFEPSPSSFDSCGGHTVTGTATDQDGGVSASVVSAPVDVVEAQFAAPLAAGIHNLVRVGQVVPIRVAVGCGAATTSGLNLQIQLVTGDVDPATTAQDPEQVVPITDAKGDTTGVMREVGDTYLYNLRVPSGTAGKVFTVKVVLAGGALYAVLEIR